MKTILYALPLLLSLPAQGAPLPPPQVTGRLQFWGGLAGDDALLSNGDPLQETGFRLRRARLGLESPKDKHLRYALTLDVFDHERSGGPLHEAWIDYSPHALFGLTLGVADFPLSYGAQLSSARLAHADRALSIHAMSPGETLGLSVYAKPWADHLTLRLGAYNGPQRAASFFEGYQGVGVSLGNRFERMAYAARVDLEPLDPIGEGEADLAREAKLRVALGGGYMYVDGQSIKTTGYSGYLHLKAWGVHLLGELIADKAEPQARPTSTAQTLMAEAERQVLYVSAGYMILKQLGVAARLELIDDNKAFEDEGDISLMAGTLTWYVDGHDLKALIEYLHREELHGVALDNHTTLAGLQLVF
ncbi:OprO/OprP family phosphate-selective porin [Myxococcota bacterium]|nr:OprO/OprP family phosphate-selective porin [Myxococcota bacterium]MBU1429857.1 OprO/OprP family phosphate-selective porin [Myxococcota bacterium]MBU1896465.1 OprO/OprP family phosphate-selective porin [Myxococcota bacterium]